MTYLRYSHPVIPNTGKIGTKGRELQPPPFCGSDGKRDVNDVWRRGVVVTELVVSTKLLYVEPG